MRSTAGLLLSLALEVAAWGGLAAGFLYLYVVGYSIPATAIRPHAGVVVLVFLAVALARLTLARLAPGRGWSRIAAALLLAGVLGILAAYYALVLVGLQSWGRVVTWDLMASYASQFREFQQTLDIPDTALAVLAAGVLAWFAGVWFYLGRMDWTVALARSADRRVFSLCVLAGTAILGASVYQFLAFPPVAEREPVSLTFYPTSAARDLQGHAIDQVRATRLDQAEDGERAAYQPAPGRHGTNVFLIVVDALRPDHMGIFGYARDTTPNLRRLESAGRVRKAGIVHASCGSSACGLLSLASSKYVHEFSDRPFTLQQALRRHGYGIHMMLSGDHTSYYSLKTSYGDVDSYFDGYTGRHFRTYFNDDQLVLDRLSAFPAADGKPVMIQFHLMSAHLLGKRHEEFRRYSPAASYAFPDGRDASEDGRPGERNVNFYDNGVLQTDAMIQRLLDQLRRKGYLEDALVAVTADHGEGLGEHGVFQHASDVYEQTLRIPFVLLTFGRKPGPALDRRSFASQVDIAPTILSELGMPIPATWSGTPMQHPENRPFTFFQERTKVGVIDHRTPGAVWKYWINSATGKEFAYDLVGDPGETRNVAARSGSGHLKDWRAQVLPGLSVQVLPYDMPGDVSAGP